MEQGRHCIYLHQNGVQCTMLCVTRGGRTLHAPIHKGPNVGTGLRKIAGSSGMTYSS